MNPKTIGLLGFDGVMALDLIGPSDAFASAIDDSNGQPSRCYKVVVIGLTNKPFVSESGVIFKPHKTILTAPALDTLIIPGGKGLREPETQKKVAEWVGSRIRRIRRIATVCTGIYGLAPTGVLDGCRVTTHWRFARDLAARFPKLNVDADAIFLENNGVHTCAGVTSGIDLSLALIEEDYGPRVALAVARELVVYLKRPGGQAQFSEPLQFQTESTDRFGDLAAWMQGHLHQDLSVETLAGKACLCSRQFSRRFKKAFGSTPAAFVEELRLGEARQRLGVPNNSIEAVAASVGFKSADAFRRAFERRFGVKPSSYRKHFAFEHQPQEY